MEKFRSGKIGVDWPVRRHQIAVLYTEHYNNNNSSGEEGVKPKGILKKEMAATGNLNIQNRITVKAKGFPTTSSKGDDTERGKIKIKGILQSRSKSWKKEYSEFNWWVRRYDNPLKGSKPDILEKKKRRIGDYMKFGN